MAKVRIQFFSSKSRLLMQSVARAAMEYDLGSMAIAEMDDDEDWVMEESDSVPMNLDVPAVAMEPHDAREFYERLCKEIRSAT